MGQKVHFGPPNTRFVGRGLERMFLGQYEHSLDDKYRVTLPARWRGALEHTVGPTALCLTRQNVPTFDRGLLADASGVLRGAYVLAEASGGAQSLNAPAARPGVILIGTGSEVQLCLSAREVLEAQGVPTRVVSMPCQEWFAAQDEAYRASVLPPTVKARVAIEAGVEQGWYKYLGGEGVFIGMSSYGASAPAKTCFEKFGITAEATIAAAKNALGK